MSRLIIHMDGGIVQDVVHDIPDLEIEILDEDWDNFNEFIPIFLNNEFDPICNLIYQYKGNISDYNPTRVNYIFKQLNNE